MTDERVSTHRDLYQFFILMEPVHFRTPSNQKRFESTKVEKQIT
jgi:hypothetical protein